MTKPSLRSLARSRRFQQALGRRLRALDHNLPAVLEHDAEALHRTRVASRRLREVLPVIEAEPRPGAHPARKQRGRVRRLTRALGGVRELDVALDLLGRLASEHPQLASEASAVRLEIQRDRAVRYADMMRRLEDIKPGRLSRDLSALADSSDAPSNAEQSRRLGARLQRRALRLDKAIEAAGSLYAFERLHLVRIAAKKLRYSLELVQELTRLGTARLVSRLKEAQGLLGRLHDLEILAAYVRRSRGLTEPSHAGGGQEGLLRPIAQETRELHAEYLRGAAALRLVAAACERDIAPRLRRREAAGPGGA